MGQHDQEIHKEGSIELKAFEFEGDGTLSSYTKATAFKVTSHHGLVDGLEESRTEAHVELDGAIHDGAGDFVDGARHARTVCKKRSTRNWAGICERES